VNYDLHWNPVRMVQRAGRIDRIGAKFPVLYIHNMFPDAGLERLLGLVERLTERISRIDEAGFLDASVLGETVHPKNFNTLRRIRAEDGTVVEQEEQSGELASNEFLLRNLLDLLRTGGQEMLDSLPHGIHSGLVKPGAKGVFFYFQADRPHDDGLYHFWRYYDLSTGTITDNRYIIANLIACSPDTPRVVADVPIFEIQDKLIEHILHSHESQQALERVPKAIDPFQQTVATTLQSFINHPDLKRQKVLDAIKYLARPLPGAQVSDMRKAYGRFRGSRDPAVLLEAVQELMTRYGTVAAVKANGRAPRLDRDDLRLICFDVLSS